MLGHPLRRIDLHLVAGDGSTRRRKAQFVVMDFHPGTLEGHLVAMGVSPESPLPFASLVPLARGVAAGLLHLHQHHMCHLDLKLDNVLVAADGRCVLCDFGTAKRFSSAAMRMPYGNGGELGGNGKHLSPELHRVSRRCTQLPADVAFREVLEYGGADAWALGCLLCEMSTGQFPFGGYAVELIVNPGEAAVTRL